MSRKQTERPKENEHFYGGAPGMGRVKYFGNGGAVARIHSEYPEVLPKVITTEQLNVLLTRPGSEFFPRGGLFV